VYRGCRSASKAMKAHNGVYYTVTGAWMFTNAGDHANAMCELYRATRPGAAQLEALLSMAGRRHGRAGAGLRPEHKDPRFHATLAR